MQKQNINSGHFERDYLNPFIDVSPPDGLIETLQRLNVTLARGQSEKDREGREQRRRTDRLKAESVVSGLLDDKLTNPDKSKWYTNSNDGKHSGQYEISSNIKVPFRGGYFGGINQLIKNTGHETTRDQLREAISKHLQGVGKNPKEINLSDWKNYLMKKRKDFCKYFLIKFTSPSYYRLFLLKQ